MESRAKTRPSRQATRLTNEHIATLLQTASLVTADQVASAMANRHHEQETVGETLVSMDLLNERDLAEAVAQQTGVPYVNAAAYSVPKDLLGLFDPAELAASRCMPLDRIGDVLIVAFAGAMEAAQAARFEELTGCNLFLYVTTLSEVAGAIDTHYAGHTA